MVVVMAVVGLADLPGRRFIYSLFDAAQIWIADLSQPRPREVVAGSDPDAVSGVG